jgi:hypothetical protein
LTDAVEKVGSKSRMRNNRIEEACCSNQSCANYWFREPKIALRHAQNLFSTVSAQSGHRPANTILRLIFFRADPGSERKPQPSSFLCMS